MSTLPRSGKLSSAALVVSLSIVSGALSGCFQEPRAAVSLRVARTKGSPSDAAVYIDEQYVGPLGYVAARGVRLPVGKHHLSVEREGYFPYDTVLVGDRQPIALKVALVRIPD